MTWAVTYWRKIAIGLAAGAAFLLLMFMLPPVVQAVVVCLLGIGMMIELVWRAVRHARRVTSWLLVVGLAVLVVLGVGGVLMLIYIPRGALYIVAVAVVVAATDVAAQLVGQRYGTPGTFFPKLSPNKTLKGVLGGLLFGVIAAVLLSQTVPNDGMLWVVLVSAPLLAIAGDLLESATKRSLGIKDFAHYIPQTGGLLDRIDSWLPVFAFAGWILA